MKVISTVAIAFAIASPALAQQQQQMQIPAPTLFSIRAGETLPLRLFARKAVTRSHLPVGVRRLHSVAYDQTAI
jgi:hypothetical protein